MSGEGERGGEGCLRDDHWDVIGDVARRGEGVGGGLRDRELRSESVYLLTTAHGSYCTW